MYRKYIKPVLDFVIAAIIITATLVLWLVIAILIKLTSKGPVLFRQERTGHLGKNFYVYKFRSMPCDNNVHDATSENQLTKIGKIIRTFSIDELPQLLNVMSGKMSLIGPRPWIPEYYKRMNTEQRRRVIVRPGITGRAQVRGRNALDVHEKLEEDLVYVDNISFKEDIKIIIMTIRAMFRKTGVEIEKLGIHRELEQLLYSREIELPNKKVLFTATVDSHILAFHTPYLKYFKDNGYEVHVATNGAAEIPYCDVRHTIPVSRSPFKLGNIEAIGRLKEIIDREKFEIIHTHTPMGSVVTRLAAISARKKLDTRVIYTAHGFHFFTGAPILNWLVYYPVEKTLARYTDVLITINQEDFERSNKHFNTQVGHVPGVGVDPKKFDFKMTKKEKSNLRHSLGLKDSDFVMIYPAELNKNKNQTMLINAMEEIVSDRNDVHLLLPGKDNLDGFHQKIAEDKSLSSNIHFLGHRSDIPHLLAISDLSVSTSLREGLPVNIMEALWAGLPVVATDCRGNRDLVIDNYNGYIVGQTESEELVDRIKLIMTNKSRIKELLANGQEVIKNHTLDVVLPKMGAIYNFDADDTSELHTDKSTDTLAYETGFFSELPTQKTANSTKNKGKRISRRSGEKSE